LGTDRVEKWDSSLPLFLFEIRQWCRLAGAACDDDALPERMRALLAQLDVSHETSVPFDRSEGFLMSVGLATQDAWAKSRDILHFVGEMRAQFHPLDSQSAQVPVGRLPR
jgi:phospholipid/cholesterol/gamma-HCH transport system permease protein